MASAFQRIADEYFDYIMSEHPSWATWLGIHKQDGKLTSFEPKVIASRLKKLESFQKKLDKIAVKKLPLGEQVDAKLLAGALKTWLEMEKRRPDHKNSPSHYVDEAIFSIYVLIERDFAPKEKRAKSVLRRMRAIPKLMRQAKENLVNPPREFTESAVMEAQGGVMFLQTTVREFIKSLRGPANKKLREDMEAAACKAEKALCSYGKFLLEDLLPRSHGKFAIGKQAFNMLLKYNHHVDYDADMLYKMGRAKLAETKRELEAIAKKINRRKTWIQIVDDLKKEHPANAGLVDYYAKEMKRAREFVRKNKLVTFPKAERLIVVPTPDFAAPTIPYAAYVSPAPYEKDKKGIFWVTKVPPRTPRARAEEQLEGHSKWGIVVTSLHEAYPGHHLQLSIASHQTNALRHLMETSVFAEGWALYCEEMMWEQGFYHDLRSRLLQLKDQLWRACRVIVDVGLHTGKMSFNDAVNFMVKEAKLERVNAVTEVRRYCQTPTQPMSYMLGKLQILALLDDYKKKHGAKFKLRKFHDELLSHGTIPVKYVRQLMGL